MKKYRLIKWYPSLPYSWKRKEGEKIVQYVSSKDKYTGGSPTGFVVISSWEVENNPEYWEHVEDKPIYSKDDIKQAIKNNRYMMYIRIEDLEKELGLNE